MSRRILCINGSSRADMYNGKLIRAIQKQFSHLDIHMCSHIAELPIYRADYYQKIPERVLSWQAEVREADALIISTPEYIHNIPAALKNALEWLTESGEMYHKPCIAITYSPNPDRGKYAMTSLLQSLHALQSQIVTTLSLYHNELIIDDDLTMHGAESIELFTEAIRLIQGS